MEYIFNVKAQFEQNEQKKKYNIEAQFEAIKKNIEGQVIHVQAKIDPNSLSLAKIQEQLKNEKLTLNIGNVTFDQSGTNAVQDATDKITESAKKATDAVKELNQAYKELSKQDVYDALNEGSLIKSGTKMNLGENNTIKSITQEERLYELEKIRKSFEETFGKTNVEVAGITNIDGALQRFIITAKNAKDEVLKFEYALKGLHEDENDVKKLTGAQFQYTGGTFGESNIRETEKAIREQVREEEKLNKELEKQRSIYAELKSAVESIAVTRSGGKGKLEGFSTDEITKQMTLTNDGTVEATTAMKQYETASKNAIEALNNFDTAIKGNNTDTQEYVSTIKTAIAEMRAYGKVIHDQQSGSVGNMGEKDVKALKEAADFQLKTFEERVNSSGLATDEFNKKIADLKTQLSGVKISDDYTKFTDQFRVIKAEFDNLTQSAKSTTAAVSNTESFTQLTTKYDNLIDKASKYEGILESLSGETKSAIASFAEIRNDGVVNENSLKQARAYYNTIKTEIDSVIAKKEEERRAYEREQQQLANQRNLGINFTNASTDLDKLVQKIKELSIDESRLTYSTKELYDAFDKVSDTQSLSALKSMMSQVSKEVSQITTETNKQTQAVENQEKEYQRLTDIVNKAYANATNTSTNSNAIQNVENIKLLRTQYDTVIEALNRLKNSTTDTFEENKKAAQQAIQGFQDYSKVLQNTEQSIKATDEAIKKLEQNTQKGFFANNANDSNVVKLKQDIDGLRNTYTQLQSQFQSQGSTAQVTQGFATLDERIKRVSQTAVDLQQNLRQVNTELSLTGQKSNLNNRIETWLKNNTKASGTTVQALKQLQAQIQSADKVSLRNLTQQFRDITRNAELAGEAGKSFLDSINEKIGKFTSWFSISQIIMGITNEVKQAIVTLKDVDTILTEISKTSERSAESLAKLGESAFDTASKYGVAVQSYLTGVQEMARAGYETLGEHQSEQMAELALLVQAAGGVSDSVARDYLIATDAAYQLGGSIEKLTSILDSQNLVTNNYAVSMQDMTTATKETASVANQYGVSIEELSALIAIAEARTKQGGNVVGNAIKSILLQTQDITNKQVVKAFDAVGISMYKIVDGAKSLKTPIELLKELADVFKTLPQGDDRRATVLSDIGGMQIYHYVQKCA